MNCQLTFNSGKTETPVELTAPTKLLTVVTFSTEVKTIELVGINETDPSFGSGELTRTKPSTKVGILVSQSVCDYLISYDKSEKPNVNVHRIEPQRSAIILQTDIKLSPTHQSTTVERVTECSNCINHKCQTECQKCINHVCENNCQNCKTHVCITDCDFCLTHVCQTECIKCKEHVCENECKNCALSTPQDSVPIINRHMLGDTLVATVCSFYARCKSNQLLETDTISVFKYWRSKIRTCSPDEGTPSEAWSRIQHLESSNGTEFMSSILRLHPFQDQELAIKGIKHRCNYLANCPLNDVACDESDDDLIGITFDQYICSFISNYFFTTYFANPRSQLGINILARMRLGSNLDEAKLPLNVLLSNLLRYDSESPAIRMPDFKKRERRDSIASTGTRSSYKK